MMSPLSHASISSSRSVPPSWPSCQNLCRWPSIPQLRAQSPTPMPTASSPASPPARGAGSKPPHAQPNWQFVGGASAPTRASPAGAAVRSGGRWRGYACNVKSCHDMTCKRSAARRRSGDLSPAGLECSSFRSSPFNLILWRFSQVASFVFLLSFCVSFGAPRFRLLSQVVHVLLRLSFCVLVVSRTS